MSPNPPGRSPLDRDDFSSGTRELLAKRVGFRCSNPGCRQATSGPQEDPGRVINLGVAAHVTAAAPGGPRYDPFLTPEQRRSAENGIWLCQTCAKLVDNDVLRYSVVGLREWKRLAELDAARALEQGRNPPAERAAGIGGWLARSAALVALVTVAIVLALQFTAGSNGPIATNEQQSESTVPSFNVGHYCAEYHFESNPMYEFEDGSPEVADSLASFLQSNQHKIVFIEMDLCIANIVGDRYNPEGFDLSVGFTGPIINLVNTDKGDITITPHSSGFYTNFKGYFKVLGMGFTPQDTRIVVELAPVPIETVW